MSNERPTKFGICDVCLKFPCQCVKSNAGPIESTGLSTPRAMTREQVVYNVNSLSRRNYENADERIKLCDELFKHDAALRQALAQQAQEVDIVSADLSEARHQIGLLQQRIDTHCVTEAELRQQVATMETNAADNGALYRAVLNEKLTLAQEVERLKRENENLSAANEAHWGKQMDVSKAIAERERDIDILKANLNEMWVDEKGTVWTRPTAWAYAMVCKARDAWQGKQELAAKQVARLREFVEMVVEVSMHWPYPDISPLDENSPLMDGARLLLQDAALRETAGLGHEEKPWTRQRPTVPGHYWFRLSPNHYVMCRIERGTEGTLFAGWLTDEFRQCGVDTLPVSGEWQPVADPAE